MQTTSRQYLDNPLTGYAVTKYERRIIQESILPRFLACMEDHKLIEPHFGNQWRPMCSEVSAFMGDILRDYKYERSNHGNLWRETANHILFRFGSRHSSVLFTAPLTFSHCFVFRLFVSAFHKCKSTVPWILIYNIPFLCGYVRECVLYICSAVRCPIAKVRNESSSSPAWLFTEYKFRTAFGVSR